MRVLLESPSASPIVHQLFPGLYFTKGVREETWLPVFGKCAGCDDSAKPERGAARRKDVVRPAPKRFLGQKGLARHDDQADISVLVWGSDVVIEPGPFAGPCCSWSHAVFFFLPT